MNIVERLEAIADEVAGINKYNHGGWVSHMAARDYRSAAFNCGDAASFLECVKFREWLADYGDDWARDYIANRRAGFSPGSAGSQADQGRRPATLAPVEALAEELNANLRSWGMPEEDFRLEPEGDQPRI